jgi:hypothetical protein
MSEREIIELSAPDDGPVWFKQWARALQHRLLKINRILASLVLQENISCRIVREVVVNNRPIQLRHNLGREHKFISIGSGRASWFRVVNSGTNQATVRVKLPATATTIESVRQVSTFPVLDASIFQVGDTVAVGDAVRKVSNIVDNVITLSDKVDLRASQDVILAREEVLFLIL